MSSPDSDPFTDAESGKNLIRLSRQFRPRKDHRGIGLISDALPFGRPCYSEPNAISNAVGYAQFYSRAESAVIRVYDKAGNVIETQEHAGDFKEG